MIYEAVSEVQKLWADCEAAKPVNGKEIALLSGK
jgi:hypothetical protein